MSIAQQNTGFDPKNPVIKGKTNVFQVVVPNLTVADVASAEWVMLDRSPVETPTPATLVTKTTASGISIADGANGLEATITINPTDTASLAGTDFYYRLDYIATTGGEHESVRGRIRLTPRA
ncbi:MAG: hypothetical protein OEU92_09405 [Alphaproteobacteria bacterium]|nr:hypothetical protein [Alphaproteobacteria bacterium]